MAGEDLETARRLIERWNERDLDGLLALCTDDFEFVDRAAFPDAATYRGKPAVRRHLEAILAALDVVFEIDELEEVADEVVLADLTIRGRGAGSGAAVVDRFFGLLRLRDGLIARRESYSTRAEALAAVERR